LREQLLVLCRLQEIDLALRQLEREASQLDDGTQSRKRAEQAHAQSEQAAKRARDLEHERKYAEEEMQGMEAKRKQYEKRMASGQVRNLKELEGMEKEVGLLQAGADRTADKVLLLIDELEGARQEADKLAATWQQCEQEAAEIAARYQVETARLKEAMAAQAAARKQVAAEVAPLLLRKYEELRTRKGGVAVVHAGGNMCGGCHVSVSVDLMRRAKAAADLTFCDNCGRVLVTDAQAG